MRKKLKIYSFTILTLLLFSGCNIFNLLGNTNNTQNTNTVQNTNTAQNSEAGAADYGSIIKNGQTEVSEELYDYFKKITDDYYQGKTDYEPIIYCDNLKESPKGKTFICKTVKEEAPEDPYWSLLCIDDEREEIGYVDALILQDSVLTKYVQTSVPETAGGMGIWNFPDSYELTQDALNNFNEACKSAEEKGELFTFEPIIQMGNAKSYEGEYYAFLCLKYFPDIEDSQWFAILYLRKNPDGKTEFLNAATILW